MNIRLFLSSSFLLLLLPFSWLLLVSCSDLDLFRSCIKQYNCGNITGVEYPFWGDARTEGCGYPHLYLHCNENQTSIDIQGVKYNVLDINTNTQILHIARVDLLDGLCSKKLQNNTAFYSEEFEYAPDSEEITLHYDCPPASETVLGLFTCPSQSAFKNVFVEVGPRAQPPMGCNSSLKVGAPKNSSVHVGDFLAMEEALREGFEVKYKEEEDIIGFCSNCTTSGGACAYDRTSSFGQTTCYCAYGNSGQTKCPPLPPSISQKEKANPYMSWTSGSNASSTVVFEGGERLEIILSIGYPRSETLYGSGVLACGFFCNGDCTSNYIFAILYVHTWNHTTFDTYGNDPYIVLPPEVVWSANRNNPVKINATLELTTSDLVLKDSDGTLTWSTNIRGNSVVAGLNLTDTGNLRLRDKDNVVIWQSFDHPTDTLLRGQRLKAGQKLTSNASPSNLSEGLYSISVTNEGFFAFMDTNPPQFYYQFVVDTWEGKEPCYVRNINGTLGFYFPSSDKNELDKMLEIGYVISGWMMENSSYGSPFMRLESDGSFRSYENSGGFVVDMTDDCAHPMACGKYGVCMESKCGCPETENEKVYFKHVDYMKPDHGCNEITPLSCHVSQVQYHGFLELEKVTYFSFVPELLNVDSNTCKEACLKNCSCKAVIFHYSGLGRSKGECYFPTEIFSLMLMSNEYQSFGFHSITYLKVQNEVPITPHMKKMKTPIVLLVSSFLALFVLFSVGMLVFFYWKKKQADEEEVEEDYLDHVPGMPERFSYEDLKAMTQNFHNKLGEGGFGTVFEGTLSNGMKVAVKRLDGFSQIKKSFLAEVATIGSIHHVNLVRMIGFCAEKSHRLLVYQYMPNGSLDKWIFHKTYELLLSWQQRKKIILDIAKGLSYLHEDCRQKIIHLDIKPENILLDEDFNGKLSDFGLSKLIERDQSQVVTTMRGTPGYLAPEWLGSVITEKVDVYSFGIVTMEVVCGRRNVDRSQPEEAMHLLSLFKQKYEENQLVGLIDKCCVDMHSHEVEVINMMKVAAWCLQSDFVKRPSMSMVVKVLEGVMDIEHNLDYDFIEAPVPGDRGAKFGHQEENHDVVATLLLPSVLSQPR